MNNFFAACSIVSMPSSSSTTSNKSASSQHHKTKVTNSQKSTSRSTPAAKTKSGETKPDLQCATVSSDSSKSIKMEQSIGPIPRYNRPSSSLLSSSPRHEQRSIIEMRNLIQAIRARNRDQVKRLLRNALTIAENETRTRIRISTVFYEALEHGDEATVRVIWNKCKIEYQIMLLESKTHPANQTILHIAARQGKFATLRMLMSHSAFNENLLRVVDDEGMNAMMHAAQAGHEHSCLTLAGSGMSPTEPNLQSGMTSICYAILSSYWRVANAFIGFCSQAPEQLGNYIDHILARVWGLIESTDGRRISDIIQFKECMRLLSFLARSSICKELMLSNHDIFLHLRILASATGICGCAMREIVFTCLSILHEASDSNAAINQNTFTLCFSPTSHTTSNHAKSDLMKQAVKAFLSNSWIEMSMQQLEYYFQRVEERPIALAFLHIVIAAFIQAPDSTTDRLKLKENRKALEYFFRGLSVYPWFNAVLPDAPTTDRVRQNWHKFKDFHFDQLKQRAERRGMPVSNYVERNIRSDILWLRSAEYVCSCQSKTTQGSITVSRSVPSTPVLHQHHQQQQQPTQQPQPHQLHTRPQFKAAEANTTTNHNHRSYNPAVVPSAGPILLQPYLTFNFWNTGMIPGHQNCMRLVNNEVQQEYQTFVPCHPQQQTSTNTTSLASTRTNTFWQTSPTKQNNPQSTSDTQAKELIVATKFTKPMTTDQKVADTYVLPPNLEAIWNGVNHEDTEAAVAALNRLTSNLGKNSVMISAIRNNNSITGPHPIPPLTHGNFARSQNEEVCSTSPRKALSDSAVSTNNHIKNIDVKLGMKVNKRLGQHTGSAIFQVKSSNDIDAESGTGSCISLCESKTDVEDEGYVVDYDERRRAHAGTDDEDMYNTNFPGEDDPIFYGNGYEAIPCDGENTPVLSKIVDQMRVEKAEEHQFNTKIILSRSDVQHQLFSRYYLQAYTYVNQCIYMGKNPSNPQEVMPSPFGKPLNSKDDFIFRADEFTEELTARLCAAKLDYLQSCAQMGHFQTSAAFPPLIENDPERELNAFDDYETFAGCAGQQVTSSSIHGQSYYSSDDMGCRLPQQKGVYCRRFMKQFKKMHILDLARVGELRIPKPENENDYTIGERMGSKMLLALVVNQINKKPRAACVKVFVSDDLTNYCVNRLSDFTRFKQLHSEHVLSYRLSLQQAGNWYLAREVCDWNLTEYLKHTKDLNMTSEQLLIDRKRIFSEMIHGLHFLHNRQPNLFHGNLKPSNILIDSTGTTRLVDFGFGKLTCPAHEYSYLCIDKETGEFDSRCWKPVEYYRAQVPYSTQSDIHAAALVSYFLLTNGQHHAFIRNANSTVRDLQEKVTEGDHDLKFVDPAARHLLDLMLKIDSSSRPTTIQVLQHPLFWQPERLFSMMVILASQKEIINITNEDICRKSNNRFVNLLQKIFIPSNWLDEFPIEVVSYITILVPPAETERWTTSDNILDLLSFLLECSNRWKRTPIAMDCTPQNVQNAMPLVPKTLTKGQLFDATISVYKLLRNEPSWCLRKDFMRFF